jgi:S-adenosyl-L-methionine hydrolase (adenosine-forming)
VIVLCTDFGLAGPYLGQVQAALLRHAPSVSVISLFSDLPFFNPRAAAYLLAAYIDKFPSGSVFLCVVDPGVGSTRRPLIVRADGQWFVGPDNGLLAVVARRARDMQQWEITYTPEHLSASFHGRDLFAPVAAQLALGLPIPGNPVSRGGSDQADWPDDLYEIVYVDHYGNAMTGVRAAKLDRTHKVSLKGKVLSFARTFSAARLGEPFWYENANGLVEIALREASAVEVLGLRVGDPITPMA